MKNENQISLEINITEYQITSFLQPIVLKLNYPNIMNMLTKIDYKKSGDSLLITGFMCALMNQGKANLNKYYVGIIEHIFHI